MNSRKEGTYLTTLNAQRLALLIYNNRSKFNVRNPLHRETNLKEFDNLIVNKFGIYFQREITKIILSIARNRQGKIVTLYELAKGRIPKSQKPIEAITNIGKSRSQFVYTLILAFNDLVVSENLGFGEFEN